MATPVFFSRGHTPNKLDCLYHIEQRILGALQDTVNALPPGIVDPEGVVTASPGLTYYNSATGGFWIKRTGTGNTGWDPLII